jgi:RHS repeat-associated protein
MQHTERLQATACPPNYRFTGYEYDSETGLNYAFARYYSSRLGRFLSADPHHGSIGILQSHNAYAYVVNNPLNAVDPSGLDTCGPPPQAANVGGGWQPPGGICTPPGYCPPQSSQCINIGGDNYINTGSTIGPGG